MIRYTFIHRLAYGTTDSRSLFPILKVYYLAFEALRLSGTHISGTLLLPEQSYYDLGLLPALVQRRFLAQQTPTCSDHECTYGSPGSDVWQEEEQLYLEMTSNDNVDGQNMWESAELETSAEPELEGGQDQNDFVQAPIEFQRCEYHLA